MYLGINDNDFTYSISEGAVCDSSRSSNKIGQNLTITEGLSEQGKYRTGLEKEREIMRRKRSVSAYFGRLDLVNTQLTFIALSLTSTRPPLKREKCQYYY